MKDNRAGKLSYRKAVEAYGIPKDSIYRKTKGLNQQKPAGQLFSVESFLKSLIFWPILDDRLARDVSQIIGIVISQPILVETLGIGVNVSLLYIASFSHSRKYNYFEWRK